MTNRDDGDYVIHEEGATPCFPSYSGRAWDLAGLRSQCQESFAFESQARQFATRLTDASASRFIVYRIAGPSFELVSDRNAPTKVGRRCVMNGEVLHDRRSCKFALYRYTWSGAPHHDHRYDVLLDGRAVAENESYDQVAAILANMWDDAGEIES